VSTALTTADVERIAALARLELTEEETRVFTTQLASILAYAEEVQRVNTNGVPATSHVLAGLQPERPDEPHESLSTADALANAPDPAFEAGLFRVPRVME